MKLRTLLGVVSSSICLAGAPIVGQQAPARVGPQFEVVSIKLHPFELRGSTGMRTEPDGTLLVTNLPILTLLAGISAEPTSEVAGYPDWVKSDRYDIIAKPSPGLNPSRDQQREMRRNLLIERLKLAGHIEEAERTQFALVVARNDGRLGPQLKKSAVECAPPSSSQSRPPQDSKTIPCGIPMMGPGSIESTAISLDRLVGVFRGPAGAAVTNRTGLDGLYDVSLHFAMSMPRPAPDGTASDDAPQFVTALQEQLGLKLVPEKTMVKIFVVDHIERPTPN